MSQTYELHIDESGDFGDRVDSEIRAGGRGQVGLVGGVIIPPSLLARAQECLSLLEPIRKRYFPKARTITGIHISDATGRAQDAIIQQLREIWAAQMRDARMVFVYDRAITSDSSRAPGAHIYRDMLMRLLKAVVFFHAGFEDDATFQCNVAHRRFSYTSKVEDYLAGQGYIKVRDARNGQTEFTCITGADLDALARLLKGFLRFRCQRTVRVVVKPYTEWDSPFMVMADWACNQAWRPIREGKGDKALLGALEGALGADRILFFCESDYDLPESLLTNYFRDPPETYLEGYLGLEKPISYPHGLLLHAAYRKAVERLGADGRPESLEECRILVGIADQFLQERRFDRLPDIAQLMQILGKKRVARAESEPSSEWDRTAYEYHDAGLRYENHTGNVASARDHLAKALRLFERLNDKTDRDLRAFHEFMNRSAVTDANEFAFERSNARLEPYRAKEQALLAHWGTCRSQILGKICGTIAQNFAFLGRDAEARDHFALARQHLGANDRMQASFRAHLALEFKRQKDFIDELAVLGISGPPDSPESFTTLSKNWPRHVFDLWLLLKGLLAFPPERGRLGRCLAAVDIAPQRANHGDHPWPIVFTELGRLHQAAGDLDRACEYWRAAVDLSEAHPGLAMFRHTARAWMARAVLGQGRTQQALELLQPVVGTFRCLQDGSLPGTLNPLKVADFDGVVRPGWFDDVAADLLGALDAGDGGRLVVACQRFTSRFTFNYW